MWGVSAAWLCRQCGRFSKGRIVPVHSLCLVLYERKTCTVFKDLSFVISQLSSASGASASTDTLVCVGERRAWICSSVALCWIRSLWQTVLVKAFLTGSCSDIALLGAAPLFVSWKGSSSWYCCFSCLLGLWCRSVLLTSEAGMRNALPHPQFDLLSFPVWRD